MMKRFAIAALLLTAASAAQAHEVWVERDGNGPARIYLGEPAEAPPEGGDPEFAKLKAPKLVPASSTPLARKAGYLEVSVPPGDVRAIDDSVFEPWGDEGKKQGVIYYARAGRSETKATMPFEIAPLAPNGNSFALLHGGKPVPGAKVTVITPDKWSKAFIAGADGTVTLTPRDSGRYLLSATHEQQGDLSVAGGKVATIYHIATTTFVAP